MKFGVREICDVVLRAKKPMKIGNYKFNEDMPVFYFDSLKTSTLESAATTVYAQGGKGNSRLIAWEGEKTVTFTMEDALISTVSLAMLSGAGVIGTEDNSNISYVHATETIVVESDLGAKITHEPYIKDDYKAYLIPLDDQGDISGMPFEVTEETGENTEELPGKIKFAAKDSTDLKAGVYIFDYYYKTASKVTMIEITPDKFAGNYYLEGSTLFRNKDGYDLPAEFIIPNCKIQSNFTFTMASSGDPSTFTFTMDAFPDYPKHDKTTKVLAAIQILEDTAEDDTDIKNTQQVTINTQPDTQETQAASISYSRRKSTVSDEI